MNRGAASPDGTQIVLALETPLAEDIGLLFARHTADMHADTPAESIHMLPREALISPSIDFFVMRAEGVPVGMGAIKRLTRTHGELKSMHILAEQRGRGLSRRLLNGLIAYARQTGLQRLSLETGVQPTFVAARALYTAFGFAECPPFGDYRADPNSVFMTLEL
ncbi:GNAT family N-acetyltransferase [Paracoccus sp. 11-3]|uniref:GNAT family N-acetyltransferase n=1 Tax=Paracoccus amoyensis TaxID=2760093 RepID=A0A926GA19_9RHOB|nr:GNAT family N-acetyltransferase [Paracoccus amoyensis]MBC9247203.1 GNAT family N-acetyltransferase [Paracoccus amoyensis]